MSGGSAAGGGFEYQAAVCAYVCVHMLRQSPLGWLTLPGGDIPVSVCAETGGPGDDLLIKFANGVAAEVQVKRGLKADNRLFEAIESLIAGLEADASLRAILVVDTRSSATVRDELREDLKRLGQGRRDGLRSHASRVARRVDRPGSDPAVAERLSLEVFPVDEPASPHRKIAVQLLADLAGDERAADVWNVLVRECLTMIAARGRRDRTALAAALGISLHVPNSRMAEPNGTDTFDLTGVLEIARWARERDLRPWILERVARPFVQTDYVPLIRGLRTGDRRVLAIVGDAGFGKTTMLGEIYDHLVAEGTGWVGVLECADITPDDQASAEDLALHMGRLVSRSEIPISDVCGRMNEAQGGGVLLVDTLDLLLGGSLDRRVGRILSDIAGTGTVIVLTCREYEFAQFASPDPSRARPPLKFVLRDAPPFSDEEVRAASQTYVELHGGADVEPGSEFAERLLNLSAGNYRLEQIVRNPLLLALLCELFATEGYIVPPDLTVSKLYETYWEMRVTNSRRHRRTGVPTRKGELCRDVAAILLKQSQDHVKTRIHRDDLPVSPSKLDVDAVDELLSDGVLRVGAAGRVEFFHQTFLEYAMARWMNLATHVTERRAFLRGTRAVAALPLLHLWPIVRQVLTTADPEDFETLVSELDLEDPMAFKVVALSALAAEQPQVLDRLAVIARERGPGYRDALLFAVGSAPRNVTPTAWGVVLSLMQGAPFSVAMQVSKPLGSLLGQLPEPIAPRLEEAISTFLRIRAEDADEQALPVALGTLMKHLAAPLVRRADADTLEVLRRHFRFLGTEAQKMVITLHTRRGDPDARAELLQQLQSAELVPGLLDSLVELVRAAATDKTSASERALAALRRLDAPLPRGWYVLQARLAGWDAAEDGARLRELVHSLLSGDPRALDRVLLTLRIAVEAGVGQAVVDLLTAESVDAFPAGRRNALSRLLLESAVALGVGGRKRVADWLVQADPIPGELLAALAVVADEERAMEAVCEGVAQLPASRRYQVVARVVDRVSQNFGRAMMQAATRAPVERGSEADAESMYVAWEHRLARAGHRASLTELVRHATQGRKKAALQAAAALATLASDRPFPVDELLPLTGSTQPTVRRALVDAALAQLEHGYPVEEEVLDAVVHALALETNTTVVLPPLFSLFGKWIKVHRHVPRASAETIVTLPERHRRVGCFDRGMARGVAHVLKVMAQSGDPAFLPQVSAWALDFFTSLDSRLISASQASMSELLVNLAQADPDFLEYALERAPSLPAPGIRVLAKTILRTLGPSSPMLDRIGSASWCPPEVRQVVLGFRGT